MIIFISFISEVNLEKNNKMQLSNLTTLWLSVYYEYKKQISPLTNEVVIYKEPISKLSSQLDFSRLGDSFAIASKHNQSSEGINLIGGFSFITDFHGK